ncbi:MAG: phosphoenolpyruvate synthase [Parcubacteria group bacterium GW2011_GWA2_51_10]|nr:MAG: phosphoenolpyruvate synthase [Parcubacteria group bacterium GW2011_GWA2_51_10]
MQIKRNINTINLNNYDFVWRTWFNYLATSFFYTVEYKDRDFVFIWNEGEYLCFVAKEERKRLAKEALELYTGGFEAFKTKMENDIPRYRRLLKKHSVENIAHHSHETLIEHYEELTKVLSAAFKDYFFLEYHSTDEVARILQNKKSRNIRRLRKNVEEMGRIKLRLRKVAFNPVWYSPYLLDKYAREIATRLCLKDDYFRFKHSELIGMLQGSKKIATARRGTIIWGKFSHHKEITGKQAEQILRRLRDVDLSVDEFKGQIGNKGIYRGRAKVIHFSSNTDFKKEIKSMRKGDVLVSGSTGPELILACKKAGAIVTDEGGVISHAAIVSREFGIPSVIGTKIATSIIKNGDIVEVNADKGTVKIFPRQG